MNCCFYNSRPLPPIPDMEVPEEFVVKAADMMRVWVNHILLTAHDIAISGNLKLFGWVCSHVILLFSLVQSFSYLFLLNVDFVHQVALGLWLISYVGSFFTLLTLLYIGE